jgi:hypothetical protein
MASVVGLAQPYGAGTWNTQSTSLNFESTPNPVKRRTELIQIEILTAALRWHAAHAHRLKIGSEKTSLDKAVKRADELGAFNPYSEGYALASGLRSAAFDAADRLTKAKRTERASLRALAKVCATERGNQDLVVDAFVVEDKDQMSLNFMPMIPANGPVNS